MGDGEFDALAREFFDWTMEANPHLATHLGLHGYDGRLPDGSRGAALAEIEGWREYRERFRALDPSDLSGSRPLDRELALFLLDLWIYEGEELRLWEAIPAAPGILGSSLLPLVARDFAPLGERMARVAERLRAAPGFLEASKGRIVRPVRPWGEVALEVARALPPFLEAIEAQAAGIGGPAREALRDARRAAEEALADYARWLEAEVIARGSGSLAIGEEAFRRLLRLRGIDMDLEELRALGMGYLRGFREELRELARGIDPGATVEEVRARLRADRPPSPGVALEEARRVALEAREFLRARGLATLPPSEELLVLETPAFLRPLLPFAAYLGPGRWEGRQRGLLMVTPPAGDGGWGRHGRWSLRPTALHEGYPGHHLQRVCANLNPSLLRQLAWGLASAEVVEGWAHYAEGMMSEEGFDGGPEARFARADDGLWRACRVLIDVDLHSGRLDLEGAVELLVREAGMDRASAAAEVRRHAQTPTYPLSYLLGRHMIVALREEVRARLGRRYTDRFFHDTILYSGALPLALLRRAFEDKVGVFEEELPG